MIEFARRVIVALALGGLAPSCGPVPSPQPPMPSPTPEPVPSPICEPGATCGCWHRPPGQDWQQLPPCSTPAPPGPTPGPTPSPGAGCVLVGAGAELPAHRPVLGARVNAVMARLTGCSVGSRCVLTVRPQEWHAAVAAELRREGLCAGQHEPESDEIAVSTAPVQPMEGYHIQAGEGWHDPSQRNTVVWSPGADRVAWAPAGAPAPPVPTPAPVDGPCPVAPCPQRAWTADTLPDGWSSEEIGRARWQFNSSVYVGRYLDNTPVVIRNEPYCASIGMSPMADGQLRAACPVRPDGHPERVAVERWLTGGFVLESRNGTVCRLHPTNPVMFELGSGNCRMCSVLRFGSPAEPVCSEWR